MAVEKCGREGRVGRASGTERWKERTVTEGCRVCVERPPKYPRFPKKLVHYSILVKNPNTRQSMESVDCEEPKTSTLKVSVVQIVRDCRRHHVQSL